MTLAELVARWRKEAELFERRGQVELARCAASYAQELEVWHRQYALEELTPVQAAAERGCDPSTIRREFPRKKRITRAEVWGNGRGSDHGLPDLAGAIVRDLIGGDRLGSPHTRSHQ
jgi:hypothetical protein